MGALRVAARAATLAVSFLVPELVGQQEPQQPGAGADVHTGTNSGFEGDARIRNLLADHQYLRVLDQVDQLPLEQAQLYRGILANRENEPQKSIQLLEPLVDKIAATGDTLHEKLARKALAEDYLRDGNLAKAAIEYQILESRLKATLTPDEQDEIEMPVKLLPLAASNPPMIVDPCDSFILQVSKNPLGLTDIPVFVDARPHTWMLDPTAPFNLIARSLAREVGLKISDETATIHTLTGRPMQVHSTVIPRFTVGGRLTFHNMTAFVFEDADYSFEQSHYQVQGVLGYAALSALSSLTVSDNATVELRPVRQVEQTKRVPNYDGARFFLDGDQILVALGLAPNEQMFIVDAAGQQTYFTSRYYDEHTKDFAGQETQLFAVPGGRALPPQPAYLAESIPVTIGSANLEVHYIQVLTGPVGSAALDDVYGVLGVDALDQFRSYTFDFENMRFRVAADRDQ